MTPELAGVWQEQAAFVSAQVAALTLAGAAVPQVQPVWSQVGQWWAYGMTITLGMWWVEHEVRTVLGLLKWLK